MSSKCRPVVGSSKRKRFPFAPLPAAVAFSPRNPASFSRWASPPLRVGTGCPRLTYPRPTAARGASAARMSGDPEKNSQASVTVMSSTSAIDFAATGGMGRVCVRGEQAHVEHFRAEPAAVAVRAAQVHVAQELHLDVLEAAAAARRAAAVARVEAEGAGRVPALHREGLRREKLPDAVERPDVAHRVRPRRPADGGLVHQHHVLHQLVPRDGAVLSRLVLRLVLQRRQRVVQHVLDQGGFARAADPGHADQAAQRDVDVDALQVVLGRPEDADGLPASCRWGGLRPGVRGTRCHDAPPPSSSR